MTEAQELAIGEFFAAADKLREIGVIRSDKYLGDIAEFLAAAKFKGELAPDLRQGGYDGHVNGSKIEVKYNGGKSETVSCGNPQRYDELIVVLGPHSVLRASDLTEKYLFYKIPNSAVIAKGPHKDGIYRFVKGDLKREYLVG